MDSVETVLLDLSDALDAIEPVAWPRYAADRCMQPLSVKSKGTICSPDIASSPANSISPAANCFLTHILRSPSESRHFVSHGKSTTSNESRAIRLANLRIL